MCMRRFVISRTMLGNREQGWTLDDGVSISEMTSKEIVNALSKGMEIYGLAVGEKGTLVLDKTFFTRNIMEHRQVGNYTPMLDEDGCMANMFYIVTGRNEKGEYNVISTKHERTSISEERCKVMIEMGIISAGAKLEDGKVILPNLDRTGEKSEEVPKEDNPKQEVVVENKVDTSKAKKADNKKNPETK